MVGAFVTLSAGCSVRTDSQTTGRPRENGVIKRTDPVRAEGNLIEQPSRDGGRSVFQTAGTADQSADPETVLRTAVADRSDCLDGDMPVSSDGDRLLISTRTIVRDPSKADIAFPSPVYDHIRAIAPASVPAEDAETETDPIPIFVQATLLEGSEERVEPARSGPCDRTDEE